MWPTRSTAPSSDNWPIICWGFKMTIIIIRQMMVGKTRFVLTAYADQIIAGGGGEDDGMPAINYQTRISSYQIRFFRFQTHKWYMFDVTLPVYLGCRLPRPWSAAAAAEILVSLQIIRLISVLLIGEIISLLFSYVMARGGFERCENDTQRLFPMLSSVVWWPNWWVGQGNKCKFVTPIS